MFLDEKTVDVDFNGVVVFAFVHLGSAGCVGRTGYDIVLSPVSSLPKRTAHIRKDSRVSRSHES